MLFWSLINVSWLLIIVDCLNRCTEWSILTFLYILLLIDQFKDDINSKIYRLKNKYSDSGVRIMIKRLIKVCLIFKSLCNLWEKFLVSCFLTYFIVIMIFTYEFFFGNQDKIFIVKFICFMVCFIVLFMFILIYSLISFVSFKKQSILSAIRSFDSLKLSINTKIKV